MIRFLPSLFQCSTDVSCVAPVRQAQGSWEERGGGGGGKQDRPSLCPGAAWGVEGTDPKFSHGGEWI